MDTDWESMLLKIYEFLDTFRGIANAHMVDFFTYDQWQSQLDDAMAKQLLLLSDEELSQMPNGKWSPAQHIPSQLDWIVNQAAQFSLQAIIKDNFYQTIQENLDGTFVNLCMNSKKCHEVERLSYAIAMLLKEHNVSKVGLYIIS